MKTRAIVAVALSIALEGCTNRTGAEEQAAMAANARNAAAALASGLGAELKAALAESGPDGAISVCKTRAPQLAAAVSQRFGVEVKRVSPKNRNPAGVPDAWEAAAQAHLERRLAGGEELESLDTWQIVATADGKQFRYARALPTQPLCLLCHGSATDIPDVVKVRLATDYPQDKAIGYGPGTVRGIISVKRGL